MINSKVTKISKYSSFIFPFVVLLYKPLWMGYTNKYISDQGQMNNERVRMASNFCLSIKFSFWIGHFRHCFRKVLFSLFGWFLFLKYVIAFIYFMSYWATHSIHKYFMFFFLFFFLQQVKIYEIISPVTFYCGGRHAHAHIHTNKTECHMCKLMRLIKFTFSLCSSCCLPNF